MWNSVCSNDAPRDAATVNDMRNRLPISRVPEQNKRLMKYIRCFSDPTVLSTHGLSSVTQHTKVSTKTVQVKIVWNHDVSSSGIGSLLLVPCTCEKTIVQRIELYKQWTDDIVTDSPLQFDHWIWHFCYLSIIPVPALTLLPATGFSNTVRRRCCMGDFGVLYKLLDSLTHCVSPKLSLNRSRSSSPLSVCRSLTL